MSDIGYLVVVTSKKPSIVAIDQKHFYFDDMIGSEENEFCVSENGGLEMHFTKQHSCSTENKRALWFLREFRFHKPVPFCVWEDVLITGKDNTLLDLEMAQLVKTALL